MSVFVANKWKLFSRRAVCIDEVTSSTGNCFGGSVLDAIGMQFEMFFLNDFIKSCLV